MKHYGIFEYVFDPVAEVYTAIKGQIKAFVDSDNAFTACEEAGFDDPNRYFAEEVNADQLKKIKDDIQKEKELLGKLDGQIDGWISGEIEKSKVCPNCESQLNERGECKACGFGDTEISVGGVVITKKEFEKAMKDAKKAKGKKKK